MEKDITNKKKEYKMVLLVCGDSQTGKKSIVNKWLEKISKTEDVKSFYRIYSFSIDEPVGEETMKIPCELRILNSDELETDLKINSVFFKNALGAFVVNSIDEESSFKK